MKEVRFKIQTDSAYLLIALFWFIVFIGGLSHYLHFKYIGSAIFAFLMFLAFIFMTTSVTISLSDDYFIAKKFIFFKTFTLSTTSIKITDITAIHYEGIIGRGIILPTRVLKIFHLNNPLEFPSGFNKKKLEKLADKLIDRNPTIERL